MRASGRFLEGALVVALLATGTSRAAAAAFIRGDANGDGSVSLADVHAVSAHVFHGLGPVACPDSADYNDDEAVDFADVLGLAAFVLNAAGAPGAPFPEPGVDPTSGALACSAYGGAGALEDPAARLVISRAALTGELGYAFITLSIASGTDIGGCSGTIRFPPGLLRGVGESLRDAVDSTRASLFSPRVDGDLLRFAYVPEANETSWLPPTGARPALDMTVCLAEGTAAGVYPLALEAGEFTEASTSRVIRPALAGGELQVTADVAVAGDCGSGPPPPARLNAAFKLANARAAPGTTAEVPLAVWADAPIDGFSVSIDFDEDVLQATGVEQTWERADGAEYDFWRFDLNNNQAVAGSGGVDEGFIVGAVVMDFTSQITFPAHEDNHVATLRFLVNPDAGAQSTELRFLDDGRGAGEPVRNMVVANGQLLPPESLGSLVLTHSALSVLPEITTFVRGDADGDARIGVTDAIVTLSHLFLGGGAPHCYDAADADDDGDIDLTDPVSVLNFAFLGGEAPPAPFPEKGEDPTLDDGLGCRFRSR